MSTTVLNADATIPDWEKKILEHTSKLKSYINDGNIKALKDLQLREYITDLSPEYAEELKGYGRDGLNREQELYEGLKNDLDELHDKDPNNKQAWRTRIEVSVEKLKQQSNDNIYQMVKYAIERIDNLPPNLRDPATDFWVKVSTTILLCLEVLHKALLQIYGRKSRVSSQQSGASSKKESVRSQDMGRGFLQILWECDGKIDDALER